MTNAEEGWIELACQTFMPSLWPAVEKMHVLSARTTFEYSSMDGSPYMSANGPGMWKKKGFKQEGRLLLTDLKQCKKHKMPNFDV